MLVPTAQAGGWSWAGDLVIGITSILISILGPILTLIIKGVVYIASYSLFIKSPAVVNGWVVVRDISNMFFIVILLIIAFATILRLENYSYKKWLPKLILMALLINFSKTICGLLIDVTQVIMLTFINSFKDIAGGNFIEMLGIYDSVTLAQATGTAGVAAGAYVLGLFYIIISIVVLVTIMMVLAMRIVMIWIYVVLSPLAYLLAAFPGGQSYASQWWSNFTKNLIVGPVLAFFIWLSFIALQSGGSWNITSDQAMLGTRGSTTGALIKFVIAIGMLIGGLKIAQEIGGEAGSIAGKGMSALTKGQTAVTNFGKKWGGKILSGDNMLARKTAKKIGFDFRPIKIKEAFQASYEKTKKDDEAEIRNKGGANLSAGGARSVFGGLGAGRAYMDNYFHGFLGAKGIVRAGQELFRNPKKRKEIKAQIDKKDKIAAGKEKNLKGYVSTTDSTAMNNKINNYDTEIKSHDAKIKSAKDELAQLETGEIDLSPEGIAKRAELKEEISNAEEEKDTVVTARDKLKQDLGGKTVLSNQDYDLKAQDVTNSRQEIRELKKKSRKYAAPKSGEVVSQYRSMINERKDKYKDNTVADELIDFYDDAVNRGDKYDQVALLEKLSNDANLNEMLNNRGYSADARGLYKFIHNLENDFEKKNGLKQGGANGFSEEGLLRIQSDLGEAEERAGHWETAKMVGYDKKGELVSTLRPTINKDGEIARDEAGNEVWDESDHVVAAVTEITKGDPQKILSMLNRLATGGEDARGNYQISTLGKVLVKILDESGTFAKQGGRLQNNLATNLNLPHIVDQLKKLNISQKSLGVIDERATERVKDMLDKVNDLLEN